MAGIFGNLFAGRPKARAADVVARATGNSVGAYGGFGIGEHGQWDINNAVKRGLERSTWVFRAVDAIAMNASRLPINLVKGEGQEIQTLKFPQLTNLLNIRPNTYENATQFRYRLSAVLLLSTRGAFIEVVKGSNGIATQLHILPPGSVRPIPDPMTYVSGYEVTRADYGIDFLRPDQVIWIKSKPHPTDPYLQLTPLQAAGISADTDFLAHIFNRNILANDGRPSMIISVNGMTNPDDVAELKRRFGGGPTTAGKVSVVENAAMDVKDIGASNRDVQWTDMLESSKQELLMAFGVPESVMGNASGRTFDNADAERENFWKDTMVPHVDSIAAGLDPLTGDNSDDLRFAADYEAVDVLQRLKRARIAEAREEFRMGLITADEYRVVAGREELNVDRTKMLINPIGFLTGEDEQMQERLEDVLLIGMPDPRQQMAMQQQSHEAQMAAQEQQAQQAQRMFGLPSRLPAEEGKGLFDHAAQVKSMIPRSLVEQRALEMVNRLQGREPNTDAESDLLT